MGDTYGTQKGLSITYLYREHLAESVLGDLNLPGALPFQPDLSQSGLTKFCQRLTFKVSLADKASNPLSEDIQNKPGARHICIYEGIRTNFNL